MGWEFEEGGSFGSEKAADDYARRNNLDPRDVRIRPKGDGFNWRSAAPRSMGRRCATARKAERTDGKP